MSTRFWQISAFLLASTATFPLAAQDPVARAPGSIEVTPRGGLAIPMAPNSSGNVGFIVTSTRPVSTNVDLVCHVAGTVTSCLPDQTSFTLPAYDAIDISVEVTTGSNGSGVVSLMDLSFAYDSGWRNISVQGVSGPTVTQPRQADSVISRSNCLTAAAGLGAWSCGDGLLFLGTPSVTTLERTRDLTLVHATNTASPMPLVMAQVAPASGSPTLDRIRAVLTVRDTVRSNVIFSAWGNSTRQLVLGWDASAHPTGAYPYTLRVYSVLGSDSAYTTLSGLSYVVNRSQSPYGKGWEWLGVERLVLSQPVGSGQSHILWVGGDGSTKLYRQASTNVWVTPREAFPDTVKLASGEYTRHGRHGVRVVFDGSGHHVRTINRVGHITRFHWTGERIDSVRVPPSGSGGRSFRLKYDGSGKLDSVVVAAGKGINVTVSSGLLTGWNWPDGTSLSLGYDGSGRVTTTMDGRGGSTRWLYGSHGLLTESRIYYAVNDSSVTRYTPWQAAGFASGVGFHSAGDTANAVTTIFGPRVGVNDDAVFHVDKWGAVTEVKDALNNITKYHRTDANVPALVTRVDFPNSRRAMMAWNSRGNLTKLTDSTWGAAAFPKLVTTWAYSSANAPDSPSSLTAPDGTVTSYAYTSLGLTDSIIDPRSHRTKFVYGTPGDSILGQVVQVIERAVPTWVENSGSESTLDLTTTLTYFATGNIRTVTSPSGGRQRIGRDSDGRIVADTNAVGLRSLYTWDSMDRQTRRIVGRGTGGTPSPGCLTNEFICTDMVVAALNPTGNVDTTLATYTQGLLTQLRDPRGVLRSWRYDLRGLMTAEIDEAGAVDSAKYDAAELVTVHRVRYIASVTSSYDALDRLTKTVIPGRTLSYLGQNANVPADSVMRTYDAVGNVLSESNRNATITRTYFATGHLKSERVVPVSNRALADSTWYDYDSGGRLRRVSWQIGGSSPDSVIYKYNSAGDLDTMRVHIWASSGNRVEAWRFEWDGLGRRRTIHYPFLSMRVDYAYDRLGTLRQIESSNPGSSYSTNRFDFTFRQDSVDVLGRPLHQTMQCPYGFGAGDPGIPCRDWLPSEPRNRYNRLGGLAVQTRVGTGPARDTLRYDRSGNLIQRRDGLASFVTEFIYPSASNRLSTQRDSAVGTPGHSDRNFTYDAAGNRLRSAKPLNDTIYWQYDAVARLVGTVRKLPPPPVGGTTLPNLDECRWHPSGRLGQPCGTGGQLGFVGENVTRSSLGWFFVHAPGIDEAVLLIYRSDLGVINQRLQAVTDGRGQLLAIADSSGFITSGYAGSGYDQAAWLGAGLTSRAQTYESRRWETDGDWGGVQQFRHRAYDPGTGTWIQEDPLGVAGGVNVYQYNNGNPVSFSDPMGLQPCPPNCTPRHAAAGLVLGVAGAVALGGVGAAGGSLVLPGVGSVAGGGSLGALGAAVGTASGVAIVNAADAVAESATAQMAGIKEWLKRLIFVGGVSVGGQAPDRTSPSLSPPQAEAPATPA